MRKKQVAKKKQAAQEQPAAKAIKVEAVPNILPETGLLRLSQIIGDRNKGITPIVPVSRSAWWLGIKQGRYPKGRKLSERVTVWTCAEIRALIARAV